MQKIIWLIPALVLLSACQPPSISATILDGGQVISLSTDKTVPADILSEARITLGANDRLLYLGIPTTADTAINGTNNITLTIRRAVALKVQAPDGLRTMQTSAFTVGQALEEAGYELYKADLIDPPAETPISAPLTVSYQPSREIVIKVDGMQVHERCAAATVGQALAEAGIPLVGLDSSVPAESESLPEDGQIRVVRVVESVSMTQKTIPFTTRSELSADLEIDQQALLQGGEAGLAITRLRTRSEDGEIVAQQAESETVVRPPQERIMGIGTKIIIRTTTVDGESIEYWRTLRLFATSYSPCRSATPDGRCSYGTSSGMRAQKGVVAMQYYWYLLFGFEHLYVPGYGNAIVGDVGGGYQGSHYWIDLGYNDGDWVEWAEWVTVYFLTPVPANVADTYILP
jgi:uncharacterized protein YabE (DUF348 family)